MTLMLYLLFALTICELLVVTLPLWEARRPLAAGIGIAVALVSGSMLGIRFSWATFLVAILSLYRVINLLRVVKDRSTPQHLLPSVRRTTLWLASMQTLILCTLAVTDV